MGPDRSEIKNDCAGEDQQQFTVLDWISDSQLVDSDG
jgi:hypothetical protein